MEMYIGRHSILYAGEDINAGEVIGLRVGSNSLAFSRSRQQGLWFGEAARDYRKGELIDRNDLRPITDNRGMPVTRRELETIIQEQIASAFASACQLIEREIT